MTIISPSLLAANWLTLQEEISHLESAGADWLHIDIMDGHFVPNLTFGPQIVKQIKSITNLKLDVHLMVTNPESWIDIFSQAGADFITIHSEAQNNTISLLSKIRKLGKNAGLALKPQTSIEVITPLVEYIDMLLIMTVEPGFGGQSFIDTTINKIRIASKIIKESGKNIFLQVDGGITDHTGEITKNAGANALVSGSYIFKDGPTTYKNKIKLLKRGAHHD